MRRSGTDNSKTNKGLLRQTDDHDVVDVQCSDADDDEEDDATSTSTTSQSQDSAIVASAAIAVDGPEVKPYISEQSSSSRSSEGADDLQDSAAPTSIHLQHLAADRLGTEDDGGRLRFFLGGRCVLELSHRMDNSGKPNKWVQATGKTYQPPVVTRLQKDADDTDGQDSLSPPCVVMERCSNERRHQGPIQKRCSGLCLGFTMLSRKYSSHTVNVTVNMPLNVRKKAARNPTQPIARWTKSTKDGDGCISEQNALALSASPICVPRIRELSVVVDRLLKSESHGKVEEAALEEPPRSLLWSVLTNGGTSSSSKNSPERCKKEDFDCAEDPQDDRKEDAARVAVDLASAVRPLPEWYYDPSKASVPISEMIGVPRPSLMVRAESPSGKRSHSSEEDHWQESDKRPKVATEQEKPASVKVGEGDVKCASEVASTSEEGAQNVRMYETTGQYGGKFSEFNVRMLCGGNAGSLTAGVGHDVRKKSTGSRRSKGYGRGQAVGVTIRTFVIRDILNLGGDPRLKYVPRGVFTEVASRYKVDATTTYRWWIKYCSEMKFSEDGSLAEALSSAGSSRTEDAQKACSATTAESQQSSNMLLSSRFASSSPSKPKSTCNPEEPKNLNQMPDAGCSSLTSSAAVSSLTASLVNSRSLQLPTSLLFCPPFPAMASAASSSGPLSFLQATSWLSATLAANKDGQLKLPASIPGSVLPFGASGLPLGLCNPALWNFPANVFLDNLNSALTTAANFGSQTRQSPSSDEPLDLSLPKDLTRKQNSAVNSSGNGTNKGLSHRAVGNAKDDAILKNLLTDSKVSTNNSMSNNISQNNNNINNSNNNHNNMNVNFLETPTTLDRRILKKNMKPKHYPFLSLQIGSFEIQSKVPVAEDVKESPNKFKVIFTRRKFVYEFETPSIGNGEDVVSGAEEAGPSGPNTQMACIVVPFSTVESFWCLGPTVVLRVTSKPTMFLGHRQTQVGCVPRLNVYQTKKSVDLTGGQLGATFLHKVTLMKPHLVEQLKIYLVLFDGRFRSLMTRPVPPDLVLSCLEWRNQVDAYENGDTRSDGRVGTSGTKVSAFAKIGSH